MILLIVFDTGARRSVADVGLYLGQGLLAERWAKPGPSGGHHPVIDGTNLSAPVFVGHVRLVKCCSKP